MMQRIWMVTVREFTATVSRKGFLVGILLMPVLIVLFAVLGPRILNSRSPDIVGQVAVVDSTLAPAHAEIRPADLRLIHNV